MSKETEMVSVNRQALSMILACLQEGADDPYWAQVYPSGYLFPAVNELILNLEGKSDPIERQTLAEIAADPPDLLNWIAPEEDWDE